MTLQNRVDPFGAIHAAAERGTFTGNRGVIHDPDMRTLLKRRWTTRAWLICVCEFRGRRRDVMGRNGRSGAAGWTELFFLDEVTALAAGHRPCFYCRRPRALAYAQAVSRPADGASLSAPQIDARLHGERLASGGTAVTVDAAEAAGLPDGAMVALAGKPHAVRQGRLLPWHFSGYAAARALPDGPVTVLTPATSLAALRGGYRPAWHGSADEAAH